MNKNNKHAKNISLHDRKAMMDLLRELYGVDEVKDDKENTTTKREPGAKSISEVAWLPPNCS